MINLGKFIQATLASVVILTLLASGVAAGATLNQPQIQIAVAVLSSKEADGLLFMREEEKLAHDVYITLGKIWGSQIFTNISRSETNHTEAVQILLNHYGLSDPTIGKGVGEFVNPTLQALYDQLIAQGRQSLSEALKVGATIEDLDIVDLQTRIVQTERADIQLVYENLERGSRNHLRSFVATLSRQTGESYQPQYLNQATFDTIIADSPERGVRGGRGR